MRVTVGMIMVVMRVSVAATDRPVVVIMLCGPSTRVANDKQGSEHRDDRVYHERVHDRRERDHAVRRSVVNPSPSLKQHARRDPRVSCDRDRDHASERAVLISTKIGRGRRVQHTPCP